MIPQEIIENKIFLIRGKNIMLDRDLAALYGVLTENHNTAVKKNIERFPNDFMFQLTKEEFDLILQTAISKRGGTRKLPYALIEQGIAMLSSVLKSKRAIQVNIQIIRTFIKLKEIFITHKDLQKRIDAIIKKHGNKITEHDHQIRIIFETIRKLLDPPNISRKKIGFERDRE
ncbi:MAG: ORF6N domain-containing protein [Candidatus Margulisbacteria bacterium]|nr:ORF6N domain-containing protein [Candidatus Margulisiibacteriota bacterium]